LPEKLAIREAAHLPPICEIPGRDGELGGLRALSVAFLSVAAPAMVRVDLRSGGEGCIGRRNGILELPGARGDAPVFSDVDRRQRAHPQDHEQSNESERP